MEGGQYFTFISCKIQLLFEKTESQQKEAEDGPLHFRVGLTFETSSKRIGLW